MAGLFSMRAADQRYQVGDHLGGGTTPPPAGEEFRVFLEHIERQSRLIEQLYEHQRRERLTVYTEWGYAASGSQIDLGPLTQDQFRVTHLYAYAGGAATIYLKGAAASPTLKIPVAATTPLNLILGDARSGGLILDRRDTRYMTTNDASSQLLICILTGETLADSYLS